MHSTRSLSDDDDENEIALFPSITKISHNHHQIDRHKTLFLNVLFFGDLFIAKPVNVCVSVLLFDITPKQNNNNCFCQLGLAVTMSSVCVCVSVGSQYRPVIKSKTI